MPLYGSVAHVQKMLRPNETTAYGSDIADRLNAIRATVSAQLEHELGRTFGAAAADTTVLVWAGASDILLLPTAARSITTVTVAGTVTAGTMTGGTAYASTLWTHQPYDPETGLIYGLRLLSGGWWGSTADGHPTVPVNITGDFSDTDTDALVPEEITYVADLLMLRTLQREAVGVAGVSGDDGTFQPPMDPWKDPTVKRILNRYRLTSRNWAV